MTKPRAETITQERAPRALLLIFAFSAWSLTGPAHVALFLLAALFVRDAIGDWQRARTEPAIWALVAGIAVTGLLAWRAAWMFPDTASDQWHAIWVWNAPLFFVVIAWWLGRDTTQLWRLMAAALMGLAFGILRKTDWSLAPAILTGLRYHFDYATTGLAFIAAVILVGLLLFRTRFTSIRLFGKQRPLFGWVLWLTALLFIVTVLVVTQSRGAALILAASAFVFITFRVLGALPTSGVTDRNRTRRVAAQLAYAALAAGLAAVLLWSTKDRQAADLTSFLSSETIAVQDYSASLGARINLYRVGMAVAAQRPLLGWGPGTSTTEYVVPRDLITLGSYDRDNAPTFSHLHSVPLEILTRFGAVGMLFLIALATLIFRAYRRLWQDPSAEPDLKTFFLLTGAMVPLFCLYDFRLINVEFRFFCILYFGMIYAYCMAPADSRPSRAAGTPDA